MLLAEEKTKPQKSPHATGIMINKGLAQRAYCDLLQAQIFLEHLPLKRVRHSELLLANALYRYQQPASLYLFKPTLICAHAPAPRTLQATYFKFPAGCSMYFSTLPSFLTLGPFLLFHHGFYSFTPSLGKLAPLYTPTIFLLSTHEVGYICLLPSTMSSVPSPAPSTK